MPDLRTLLSISPWYLVLGLVTTSSFLVVLTQRRLSIFMLLLQYFFMGILLAGAAPLHIALAKILVGAMVFLILYPTIGHIDLGRRYVEEVGAGTDLLVEVGGPLFRIAAVILAGVIAYGVYRGAPLEGTSAAFTLGCYWLTTTGLLGTILGRGPFRAGLGLLTLQMGLEMLITTWERGLVVAGLLGMVNILIALAVSYLAAAEVARMLRAE